MDRRLRAVGETVEEATEGRPELSLSLVAQRPLAALHPVGCSGQSITSSSGRMVRVPPRREVPPCLGGGVPRGSLNPKRFSRRRDHAHFSLENGTFGIDAGNRVGESRRIASTRLARRPTKPGAASLSADFTRRDPGPVKHLSETARCDRPAQGPSVDAPLVLTDGPARREGAGVPGSFSTSLG